MPPKRDPAAPGPGRPLFVEESLIVALFTGALWLVVAPLRAARYCLGGGFKGKVAEQFRLAHPGKHVLSIKPLGGGNRRIRRAEIVDLDGNRYVLAYNKHDDVFSWERARP
jgi:hypothetical protein